MTESPDPSAFGNANEDQTLKQLEIAQQQTILYARELRLLYNAEKEKRRQLEIAHEALEEAHQRLAELDEVKTAFVDVVSHELRTPLAILRGYMELIHSGVAGDMSSDQRTFFEVAMQKADQLTDIIEELTTFSRLSSNAILDTPGIASLGDVVGETQRLFEPISRQRRIAFRVDAPVPLPDYQGDPGLVQLILRHLLRNAFEFNSEGGEVVLEIQDLSDAVQLRVIDTGEGIPGDKQKQIFDSFRQVESHLTRHHQGLGLGLSVVQRAVARLQGQVQVQSQIGQGSTFTVRLPYTTAAGPDPLAQLSGSLQQSPD